MAAPLLTPFPAEAIMAARRVVEQASACSSRSPARRTMKNKPGIERVSRPDNTVLVDDRCLYRGGTGVSMYLRNLLRCWAAGSGVEMVGLCTHHLLRKGDWPGPGVAARAGLALKPLRDLSPPRPRAPLRARRVVQKAYGALLAAVFRSRRYACHFQPNYLAVPCGGCCVSAVHDLSVLEHPEWHPADRVKWWEADLARSVAATDHWIVPSHFTRKRMVEILDVPSENITVIPYAARPLPYSEPSSAAARKAEAGLPDRYLLHLGTLEPRKNLAMLLDAYARLSPSLRRRCPLILAGRPGWGARPYWRGLLGHPLANEVLTTGYVGDEAAALLLAGAAATVVPSLYEGFGLPVLESMACGTPVICSTAEACVEVAADAAEMVAPCDEDAWARAMERCITEEDWARQHVEAGRARQARFSWHRTAKRHADCLAWVLGRRVPVTALAKTKQREQRGHSLPGRRARMSGTPPIRPSPC